MFGILEMTSTFLGIEVAVKSSSEDNTGAPFIWSENFPAQENPEKIIACKPWSYKGVRILVSKQVNNELQFFGSW